MERFDMMPFDNYPEDKEKLLQTLGSNNCRHEYGRKLQRLTGQRNCAYCGLCLTDTYEHWLMMTVDHVVPTNVGADLGIDNRFLNSLANSVLCCSACNGFRNTWQPELGTHQPHNFEEFIALRDEVFLARRDIILKRHLDEREFFESQPWK